MLFLDQMGNITKLKIALMHIQKAAIEMLVQRKFNEFNSLP
jgi:hypothetical protein